MVIGYGQATPDCGRVPELTGNTAPEIGNGQFALVAWNSNPHTRGVVLLGLGAADLRYLGTTFLVEPRGALVLPLACDALGTGALPLPIPDRAELIGAKLFAQVLFGSRCVPSGLAASRGVMITLTR
jgi:hypothetical protein